MGSRKYRYGWYFLDLEDLKQCTNTDLKYDVFYSFTAESLQIVLYPRAQRRIFLSDINSAQEFFFTACVHYN